MCKGNVRNKAEILFDIAAAKKEDLVAFNSGRLTKAFKNIIFFSEIFPKKYQNEFPMEISEKTGDMTPTDTKLL